MRAVRAVARREWLQKHATPSSSGGDFHWHPAAVAPALRAEIAEQARGCAAWARLGPGRVVWAVGFEAIAPADGRRYPGLVVTVVEGDASAAALLAAVPAIAAAPWDSLGAEIVEVEAVEPEPLAAPAASAVAALAPDEAGAAAAALRTGEAMACASVGVATPGALASLDAWIDVATRARVRDVAIRIGAPAPAAAIDHYAGQAWRAAADDAAGARRVWRAAAGLAARDGLEPAAFFDELAALAAAWHGAGELDAWLSGTGAIGDAERAAAAARGAALIGDDAGRLWNRVVHAWGRGCFAAPVGDRLAAALARRILADHLIALERAASPLRYWRRLRWEALVPRDARAQLEDGVRARIPTLVGAGGGRG
jgi:hypothetical protein